MRPLALTALIGCAMLTTNCAGSRLISTAAPPPRIETPGEALRACTLYRLPTGPTHADLEVGYAMRGAQLVTCDARRKLAVDTHAAEHALEDKAAAAREKRLRPWWKFW